MDKEHIKGAADKAKGSIKDAAGGLDGRHQAADGRQDRQGEGRGA